MLPARNDPCPCGSAAKAKRCCLPRLQEVDRRARAAMVAVAETVDARSPDDEPIDEVVCAFLGLRDLRMFSGSGDQAPLREALLTVLGDAEDEAPAALRGSEHRLWEVRELPGERLARVVDVLDGADGRLLVSAGPLPELEPGDWLAARTVTLEPGVVGVLGAVMAVAPEAREWIADELAEQRERWGTEELWRRAGSELASAAWCWPVTEERTVSGEDVVCARATWGVSDLKRARRVLEGAPELRGPVSVDVEGTAEYDLVGDPGLPVALEVLEAPRGTAFRRCCEDADADDVLARIDLGPAFEDRVAGDLSIFAPTVARRARAEALVTTIFAGLLDGTPERDEEPDVPASKWKREVFARTLDRLGLDVPAGIL